MVHKTLLFVTCCTSSLPFCHSTFSHCDRLVLADLKSELFPFNNGNFSSQTTAFEWFIWSSIAISHGNHLNVLWRCLNSTTRLRIKTSTTFLTNWNSGPCNNRRSACNEWTQTSYFFVKKYECVELLRLDGFYELEVSRVLVTKNYEKLNLVRFLGLKYKVEFGFDKILSDQKEYRIFS